MHGQQQIAEKIILCSELQDAACFLDGQKKCYKDLLKAEEMQHPG